MKIALVLTLIFLLAFTSLSYAIDDGIGQIYIQLPGGGSVDPEMIEFVFEGCFRLYSQVTS